MGGTAKIILAVVMASIILWGVIKIIEMSNNNDEDSDEDSESFGYADKKDYLDNWEGEYSITIPSSIKTELLTLPLSDMKALSEITPSQVIAWVESTGTTNSTWISFKLHLEGLGY